MHGPRLTEANQQLQDLGVDVQIPSDLKTMNRAQVLELNQTRQDVAKRLDDLIEQVDQLDAQLDAQPGGGLDLPGDDDAEAAELQGASPGAGT